MNVLADPDSALSPLMTERDIALRKSLFRFDRDHETVLLAFRDAIVERLDQIVGDFYVEQMHDSEVAAQIGDAETLRGLHRTMRQYVIELFGGDYGAAYVESRLRVGRLHQRRGIPAQLYISSVKRLADHLDRAIGQANAAMGPEAQAHCRDAVHKLLLFDAQLVFDTYISSLADQDEVSRSEIARHALDVERKVAERTRMLEDLARTDALTGLLNRRTFFELVERELSAAGRYAYPLSLVYLDLNGFKSVNDDHGHQTGDAVLARVGEVIGTAIRDTDIAGRYGGDEFCIALPHATADHAERLCMRLADTFDRLCDNDVSMSMGIAQTGPEVFAPVDILVKTADAAMYEAKRFSRAVPGHVVRIGQWNAHRGPAPGPASRRPGCGADAMPAVGAG